MAPYNGVSRAVRIANRAFLCAYVAYRAWRGWFVNMRARALLAPAWHAVLGAIMARRGAYISASARAARCITFFSICCVITINISINAPANNDNMADNRAPRRARQHIAPASSRASRAPSRRLSPRGLRSATQALYNFRKHTPRIARPAAHCGIPLHHVAARTALRALRNAALCLGCCSLRAPYRQRHHAALSPSQQSACTL